MTRPRWVGWVKAKRYPPFPCHCQFMVGKMPWLSRTNTHPHWTAFRPPYLATWLYWLTNLQSCEELFPFLKKEINPITPRAIEIIPIILVNMGPQTVQNIPPGVIINPPIIITQVQVSGPTTNLVIIFYL